MTNNTGEPKRNFEKSKESIDLVYLEEMVKYIQYTNQLVDLSKFTYAEIQIHPFLYKIYLNKLAT